MKTIRLLVRDGAARSWFLERLFLWSLPGEDGDSFCLRLPQILSMIFLYAFSHHQPLLDCVWTYPPFVIMRSATAGL
jgi:hypothetical protein